jgi:hypothetical protein
LQKKIESKLLKRGMNTLIDTAKRVQYSDPYILIQMESGVEVRFPVAKNPRLSEGTPAQLSNVEISPFGIHWPDLDEDLSFEGLLRGDFGQNQKMRKGWPNQSQ